MIAIEGMGMPKRCAECKLCIRHKTNDYGSYGQCMAQNCETVNTLNWSLPPSCPLVEIVTCKDCKSECTEKNGEKFSETRPDFFCADAGRSKS